MTGLGVQRAFYSACLTWFWETRVLIGAIHTHLPCKLPRGSLGADEVTTSFWEGHGSSEWFLVIGLKEGKGEDEGRGLFPFTGRSLFAWEAQLVKSHFRFSSLSR